MLKAHTLDDTNAIYVNKTSDHDIMLKDFKIHKEFNEFSFMAN